MVEVLAAALRVTLQTRCWYDCMYNRVRPFCVSVLLSDYLQYILSPPLTSAVWPESSWTLLYMMVAGVRRTEGLAAAWSIVLWL
jgi:hypothetical protein